MPPLVDLFGQVFGKLTVMVRVGTDGHGNVTWKCRCECGETTVVSCNSLRSGKTTSCTCSMGSWTHRKSETGAYRSWAGMLQRCKNSNNPRYKDWGGRGITICERWLKFENFYKDMGDRPVGKTLDRRNNSLGYFKRNCMWSTPKEQAQRRRPKMRRKNDNT
jgi:hypothetical protein